MFCSKCGGDLNDDMNFCPKCGRPVKEGASEPEATECEVCHIRLMKVRKGFLVSGWELQALDGDRVIARSEEFDDAQRGKRPWDVATQRAYENVLRQLVSQDWEAIAANSSGTVTAMRRPKRS